MPGLRRPSGSSSARELGLGKARVPWTHGRFHHFSDSGTAFSVLGFDCGAGRGGERRGDSFAAFRVSNAAFGGGTGVTGPFSAGGAAEARAEIAASSVRWASVCWYRRAFSFMRASFVLSKTPFVRALNRAVTAVTSRKVTASTQPALNRKRLRYEQPPSTHSRCIGRPEGSVTGRERSSSSGSTASVLGCRNKGVFIPGSPESHNRSSLCVPREMGRPRASATPQGIHYLSNLYNRDAPSASGKVERLAGRLVGECAISAGQPPDGRRPTGPGPSGLGRDFVCPARS
jgi:hypothetical protein